MKCNYKVELDPPSNSSLKAVWKRGWGKKSDPARVTTCGEKGEDSQVRPCRKAPTHPCHLEKLLQVDGMQITWHPDTRALSPRPSPVSNSVTWNKGQTLHFKQVHRWFWCFDVDPSTCVPGEGEKLEKTETGLPAGHKRETGYTKACDQTSKATAWLK